MQGNCKLSHQTGIQGSTQPGVGIALQDLQLSEKNKQVLTHDQLQEPWVPISQPSQR
jgi:hypothetical protein